MDLIFFGIFNSWSAGQVLDMKSTTTQDISYLFKILADDLSKIFKMAPIKKKRNAFCFSEVFKYITCNTCHKIFIHCFIEVAGWSTKMITTLEQLID